MEPFRSQATYASAHALHAAAGRGRAGRPRGTRVARAGGLGPRAVAAAHAARREGADVVARVPAAGARRATLVLTAHHDAAHTGLAWHPALARAARTRRLQRQAMDPFMAPTGVGFALAALPWRPARRAGRLLLALSVLADADIARSPTVPGASDDATGVAALIALAGRFAAEPLPGVEVLLASTGCEESGMGGMAALLREHPLEAATSFVLGLDTLGAGRPIVARAEGPLLAHAYRPGDLALVDAGARRAGLPPPERWRLRAVDGPGARALRRAAGRLPAVDRARRRLHGLPPADRHAQPCRLGPVEACAEIAAGVAAVLSDVYVS